ncbi:CAP domain-containing protein [Streptomyces sp. HMX87]|uniref:CAP domain-containing protein n=1 Tax=Streptomyces sp. HMX87 TaxID=3390849 RepID=UPI003A8462CD
MEPKLSGTWKTVIAACAALAALWEIRTAPAWAGPPPVPSPPAPYQAPLWPTPEPGRWQAPSAPPSVPAAPQSHEPAGGDRRVRMVAAVNQHRRKAGCKPVRADAALGRAAQAHSEQMARRHRLTHTGTDGSSPADRMRAAGYPVGSAGENLTAGPGTAQAAAAVWMRSPAHRVILLTCRYTHAGVGVADGAGGPWWTLDLASGR